MAYLFLGWPIMQHHNGFVAFAYTTNDLTAILTALMLYYVIMISRVPPDLMMWIVLLDMMQSIL